jgi:hypothetical protein
MVINVILEAQLILTLLKVKDSILSRSSSLG